MSTNTAKKTQSADSISRDFLMQLSRDELLFILKNASEEFCVVDTFIQPVLEEISKRFDFDSTMEKHRILISFIVGFLALVATRLSMDFLDFEISWFLYSSFGAFLRIVFGVACGIGFYKLHIWCVDLRIRHFKKKIAEYESNLKAVLSKKLYLYLFPSGYRESSVVNLMVEIISSGRAANWKELTAQVKEHTDSIHSIKGMRELHLLMRLGEISSEVQSAKISTYLTTRLCSKMSVNSGETN